jgi:prevent-host-death family protein
MSKQYSIAEARDNFTSVVHEAEEGERVELTRRGKAVAVLISLDEYRKLSKRRRSFWEAYEEFRRKHAGSDVDTADVFAEVRDPSPGRDFSW